MRGTFEVAMEKWAAVIVATAEYVLCGTIWTSKALARAEIRRAPVKPPQRLRLGRM